MMAIEYAKVIEKYVSNGLSEKEEKVIKATLKKLIVREIEVLEKEKEMYKTEMEKFEKKYNISSEEFLKKFNNGEMGDDLEYFEWYAYVDSYNRIKERQKH
ncbi:MAG: hypothetical protein ACE5KT_08820 [Methanosarcinales archaeon]